LLPVNKEKKKKNSGTPDFVPIHYVYNSVPFEELTALYAVADLALISSSRDGMNLVLISTWSILTVRIVN